MQMWCNTSHELHEQTLLGRRKLLFNLEQHKKSEDNYFWLNSDVQSKHSFDSHGHGWGWTVKGRVTEEDGCLELWVWKALTGSSTWTSGDPMSHLEIDLECPLEGTDETKLRPARTLRRRKPAGIKSLERRRWEGEGDERGWDGLGWRLCQAQMNMSLSSYWDEYSGQGSHNNNWSIETDWWLNVKDNNVRFKNWTHHNRY